MPRIWLFVLAITIHNFPEGLAVGVSFGSGDVAAGLVIATAIGLQNMPEGLAVALPLLREGYSRRKALGYGTLTGLVEPIGGLLGAAIVVISRPLLPWGLAGFRWELDSYVPTSALPIRNSKSTLLMLRTERLLLRGRVRDIRYAVWRIN